MKEIQVLENSVQTANLVAIYSPNPSDDELIFQHVQTGENPGTWGFTPLQVRIIVAGEDVQVHEHIKQYSSMGTFDISYCTNWLYNHSLHPDPVIFRQEILELLRYSLYGSFAMKGERNA